MSQQSSLTQPKTLIPVTLLTGFLGSGKTTVLNHWVRQVALADALVIINEFGEIALDHDLIAHSTENVVMEMSSGCLCCTIRGDLVKTLRDITWRFARNGQKQFGRVLIETTGLADPAPIIHTLMTDPHIAEHYALDGVVTTVDVSVAMSTLDHHTEAVKQVAMADALLLTKADLADPADQAKLANRLQSFNPAASRWSAHKGEVDPRPFLDMGLFSAENKQPQVSRWLREEAYSDSGHGHQHGHGHGHGHGHEHDLNRHDDHIRAFCFQVETPISSATLSAWLELLIGMAGSHILRIKGIVNVEGHDQPLVLHGVQHIFYPPIRLPEWPSADRRTRLVFITRDVSLDVIAGTFEALQQALPESTDATA